MATTTPNFGWAVPTSTDLVKDGAVAIETLGDSIDASLVDLKGGTTNQVLAKNSNTDMDFKWVSDATGMTNPMTTTGDVIYSSSGSTPARLGIGTAGQVLQVNSGATAPEWATPSAGVSNAFFAGKNKIINGDFTINQRAFTSATTPGTYGFDRWAMQRSNSSFTYSAQTFTPGAAPVAGYEYTNFARGANTTDSSSSEYCFISQKMEDVRTFANQTVTVSFWAKAASGTPKLGMELRQTFGGGGSSAVDGTGQSATLSTSWARYSVTIAVPSISGKTIGTSSYLELIMWFSAGSTYATRSGSVGNQTATIDVWGVQVEAGSTATDFQTATGTIAGELAACKRYYQVYTNGAQSAVTGQAFSSAGAVAPVRFEVEMRVAPTIVLATLGSGSGQVTFVTSGLGVPATLGTLVADNISKFNFRLYQDNATSAFTAGNASIFTGVNADIYKASAEL
jgi:hypothetical protein